MQTALQLLNEKAYKKVVSINSSTKSSQAMKLLVKNNICAVTVMEKGKIRGIFSERDFARCFSSNEFDYKLPTVQKAMTKNVVYIKQDIKLTECMSLIDDIQVNYLLVLDCGIVIGIISACDFEKAIIAQQKMTIDHLSKYICGNL